MKICMPLVYFAFILSLLSCQSTRYYQMYEVKTDSQMDSNSDRLIYENEHCLITYHLWNEHGNIGFKFYNKSEEDIYLFLDKSFFILNDIAYPYYSACSSSHMLDTNKGECYMIIPRKTARYVSKFTINDQLIRSCDLYKYPSRSEIRTIHFDSATSPLVFSNRLTYVLESQNQPQEIENSFYVSGITNYNERDFLENSNDDICNQKLVQSVRTYKFFSADKFYLLYIKSNDRLKH